ncbi:unnamed protein product [Ilex paraguariensis]|uniref:Wall-associated receptor kinase galacturonan-binding domain-containing protein n=1 Tax=Ilex paraguariensis TaxID=185542 RepID=A0ABC8UBP1_9AQUA
MIASFTSNLVLRFTLLMMMRIRPTVFLLVFSFFIVSPSEGDNSTHCSQYCRGRRVNRYLPSPFGFTAGCGVQLNCSEKGDIKIGEFQVQNVTADYILVNIPPKCNRPIEDLRQVNGDNYALSWRNGFLLQNCTSPSNDCVLPYSLVENRFQLQDCESKGDNISCYSEAYSGSEIMDFNNLRSTNCKVLFTSIAVDLSNSSRNNSAVSLEFQTLELQWWLRGQCQCTNNTICKKFSLPDGATGFRCSCKDGFAGDGFASGGGCRKEGATSVNFVIPIGNVVAIRS